MSKVLIISATVGKNLILSTELQNMLQQLGTESEILKLVDYDLPLFVPGYDHEKEQVRPLTQAFINAQGFLFCAPEYNGGVPPVLANAISWISVSTENWRDAFNNKVALLASFSAGGATRYFAAFRSQLEYMGTVVMPRNISVSGTNPLRKDSAERILKSFIGFLDK